MEEVGGWLIVFASLMDFGYGSLDKAVYGHTLWELQEMMIILLVFFPEVTSIIH